MDNKVVFLGNASVGKTSIIHRFIHKNFFSSSQPTIGAAFVTSIVKVNDTDVRLNIWDTAGSERYRTLVPLYYRNANVAVIVFDLSDYSSFTDSLKWLEELDTPHVFLVGNKFDIKSFDTEFILKEKNLTFIEVSAKTGLFIDELFYQIASKLQSHPSIDLEQTLDLTQNIETNNCNC